ncbi:hypothetical protein GCM10025867_15230 [Frondihabitans sucicola]|uniref:DUF4162 domain-containing protein n=1 Tax=Frondihabitans sucicola TaxID=1268041 RepID=A0ABM8GLI9_9MICO|nr:hypothetical protein GCM10025867_15230 [Frondihabitans sucicola]
MLGELGTANIELHDAGMRRPTLDDVFLKLTGRSTEIDEPDDDAVAVKGRSAKKRQREKDLA